jgi:hypothetical protein
VYEYVRPSVCDGLLEDVNNEFGFGECEGTTSPLFELKLLK